MDVVAVAAIIVVGGGVAVAASSGGGDGSKPMLITEAVRRATCVTRSPCRGRSDASRSGRSTRPASSDVSRVFLDGRRDPRDR